MKVKAIFPAQRAKTVSGIDLAYLKELVGKVDEVRWRNGGDWIGRVTSKEFMRRLNAMPEGCEVAVMGGPNHAKRKFPCDTHCEVNGTDHVTLTTDFCY